MNTSGISEGAIHREPTFKNHTLRIHVYFEKISLKSNWISSTYSSFFKTSRYNVLTKVHIVMPVVFMRTVQLTWFLIYLDILFQLDWFKCFKYWKYEWSWLLRNRLPKPQYILQNHNMPSHPLLSPSPPAPNPSQHQGLLQWVNSLHEVAKVLEFQPQHQSFQWTPRTDLL